MATGAPKAEPGAEAPKPLFKGRGIVKSVLSADSIVIQEDKPTNQGPPQERTLTLSSLSAPRLARPGAADTKDEPFAWESREFVRKAVVGKRIFFAVDYVHPTSGREYCTVYLPGPNTNSSEPGENLNNLIVSEGWATVFRSGATGAGKKADTKEALIQLEEAALAAGKGLHTKDKSKAEERATDNDIDTLIKQLKGKQLNAVVEQVRTGSSVRVTVLPTRHTFQILLSGVQCPGWKKVEGAAEPQPEPFAREAKFFVEQHVLQRDVQLTIDGVAQTNPNDKDKTLAFSGSIEYQGHDVSEELLKAGLAKYVAYSAAPRGNAVVQKLKAAEQNAKDNKRRLFANYTKAESFDGGNLGKEFTGKVISIQNTGAILVIPDGSSTEVQINLSSIKVPRAAHPNDEKTDALEADKKKVEELKAERAWAAEGKELLRKRLIGQKVRVVFDYVRKAQKKEGEEKGLPEKSFYSVYQNDQNLAVVLVESGFASVMPGRQGDDKSMDFEVLLMAESKAKAAHKGVHAPAAKAPVRRINDLCVDSDDTKQRANQIARTKQFLAGFERERTGSMKAIVDHVFSGGRFKVSVPKQSTVFMFSLAGVRVPKRDEGADSAELSNAALQFSREKLHQYEVSIEVEGLDKGGNFVGSLFLSNKKNFAAVLLEAGFAYVHHASAEKMRDGRDLIAAEEAAKQKKSGVWKNYDEEEEKRKAAAAAEESASSGGAWGASRQTGPQPVELVVTEIVNGARMYVQVVGAEAAGLDELVSQLTELSVSEGGGLPLLTPKVGDLVRGHFTEDDQWYRAKVLEVKGDKYTLQYIDYGNSETVPASRIRSLPPNFNALPAQAQLAGLAYIKPLNPDSEFFQDAKQYLRDLIGGKKLTGTIEYRDNGVLFVNLTDPAEGFNVTQEMIRGGVARLERSKRRHTSSPVFTALRDEEDKAKNRHVGIWYMGDVADSDEDEGPSIKGQTKGKPTKEAAKDAPAAAAAPKKK